MGIQTSPLIVAEVLLLLVQNTSIFTEDFCTAFSQIAPADRLTQRINALLTICEHCNIQSEKFTNPSQSVSCGESISGSGYIYLSAYFHY
jgi:hypothetical protein